MWTQANCTVPCDFGPPPGGGLTWFGYCRKWNDIRMTGVAGRKTQLGSVVAEKECPVLYPVCTAAQFQFSYKRKWTYILGRNHLTCVIQCISVSHSKTKSYSASSSSTATEPSQVIPPATTIIRTPFSESSSCKSQLVTPDMPLWLMCTVHWARRV